jgi:hypothetical protein
LKRKLIKWGIVLLSLAACPIWWQLDSASFSRFLVLIVLYLALSPAILGFFVGLKLYLNREKSRSFFYIGLNFMTNAVALTFLILAVNKIVPPPEQRPISYSILITISLLAFGGGILPNSLHFMGIGELKPRPGGIRKSDWAAMVIGFTGLIAFTLSGLALVGHISRTAGLYQWSATGMALNTAISVIALSVGALAAAYWIYSYGR